MCQQGTTMRVPTPDWLWNERANPKGGIAIDMCIAEQIEMAWEHGARTLSSCCGHGVTQKSIVITNDPEQIEICKRLFPDFVIYQWQLTIVN